MQKMLGEMKKGLNIKTNPQAAVKMIPSFVEALPDGTGNIYIVYIFNFFTLNKTIILSFVFFLYCNEIASYVHTLLAYTKWQVFW